MATTVASILDRASILLQDTTNIRWSQAELVEWLNDGQYEIALLKPNAFVKSTAVPLVAGTKQTLPSDGVSLVDVVRNMGSAGSSAGTAIRMVSREILDAQVNGWHASTASATLKHYVYSPLNPKVFYVYPPASTPTYIEMVYVAAPADASLGGNITIDDIYKTPLIDYIIYRAYSKDAEYAANKTLADAYYESFKGLLAGKTTAEMGSNPEVALAGMNPNVPGSTK